MVAFDSPGEVDFFNCMGKFLFNPFDWFLYEMQYWTEIG